MGLPDLGRSETSEDWTTEARMVVEAFEHLHVVYAVAFVTGLRMDEVRGALVEITSRGRS